MEATEATSSGGIDCCGACGMRRSSAGARWTTSSSGCSPWESHSRSIGASPETSACREAPTRSTIRSGMRSGGRRRTRPGPLGSRTYDRWVQLEQIEVIPYSLPFREPYITARGELHERRLILVRMRGEGLEGWGETAALSLRGGIGIDEIATQIRDRCWPGLLEGDVEPNRIWSAIARCRNRGASPPAVAAVDIALHDLIGQATTQPTWRLLGARR